MNEPNLKKTLCINIIKKLLFIVTQNFYKMLLKIFGSLSSVGKTIEFINVH